VGVELVQDDLRDGVPFQVHDDPHPVPVRFVPQVADPLDLLPPHQGGYLFDEARLVHLVGKLGYDDAFLLSPAGLFHHRPRPELDDPPPVAVGLPDAAAAVDEAGGGKIGARYDLVELVGCDGRVVYHGHQGVDELTQVVGRYVGSHADGDPRGSVHQEVRKPGGKNHRLRQGLVEVRRPVDGLLVYVLEKLLGHTGHSDLGVPHGRRGVAVYGAEVSLTPYERVAQGKVLNHPYDRVVDGGVTVRMVLTEHFPDHAGRFLVRLVVGQAQLVHGVQDPPVDRLESVAGIGQSPSDDDAHGVVQVGLAHLVFNVDRQGLLRHGRPAACRVHQSSVLHRRS
jgi:hypothetical protein